MVKKLVSSLLIAASVITILPIGASAEWKEDSAGYWYSDGSSYYTGWKEIDNKWYDFGSDGYMRKGWIQDGGAWYYLQDNGSMVTGSTTIANKTYEFDNNGKWVSNLGPSQDKLQATSNFSWFTDNGNTYFKTKDNKYLMGTWNIDGSVYIFDNKGVMQKGKYTSVEGKEYLFGDDGKFVTCINDKSFRLVSDAAVTTKSTSNNSVVKLDDSNMLTIVSVFSNDSSKNGINSESVKVEGKTLYCKTNQSIKLGTIKVSGTDADVSSFPNLIIKTDRTDKEVAFPEINLNAEDGFLKDINQTIITHKAGTTTITIDINGTKTSFDIVVTE